MTRCTFRPTATPIAMTTALALLVSAPATAQIAGDRVTEQPVAEAEATATIPTLEDWNPAMIGTVTLVTDLEGHEVIAPTGERLGEIDDVLINNGTWTLYGFLMDTGLVIPFGDVTMSVSPDNKTVITAPAHAYSPVDEVKTEDVVPTREGMQPAVFTAEDVMDRHMLLNDAVRFGDVVNLAFNGEGRLVAVEAQYDGTPGTRYALPIPTGTIMDAEADGFYLPYDFEDVKRHAPVDATASR